MDKLFYEICAREAEKDANIEIARLKGLGNPKPKPEPEAKKTRGRHKKARPKVSKPFTAPKQTIVTQKLANQINTKIDSGIDVTQLTLEEQDAILLEVKRRMHEVKIFNNTEELLTSPDAFGVETATDLQRAICRILDGRALGDLAKDPVVQEALGTNKALDFLLTDEEIEARGGILHAPPEVDVLAAVRTAKSMLAAARAVVASQSCPIDHLGPGEIPRYSILSLSKDNARVVLGHLCGLLSQPMLEPLKMTKEDMGPWSKLIDDMGADVIGSEFLWHPCGRPVEIRVVAGQKGGGSLVSRWSIGAVFDEAPRMVGASDGVINYDDARRAVRTRLLPGAQILSLGSPWQPYGPIFDRFNSYFGEPTPTRVILRGRGPDLNPFWWTPERCAEIEKDDPIAFQTDVKAEFADMPETLFTQLILNQCSKVKKHIEWSHRCDYEAALDPATRNNAWTFAISSRIGIKKKIVYWKDWQGTSINPLKPRVVLGKIGKVLKDYHLTSASTDQWSADALSDIASNLDDNSFDLIVEDWKGSEKVDAFTSLATQMIDGKVDIPDESKIRKDMTLVKRKVTNNGIQIVFPQTADGRHCDYAQVIARVFVKWLNEEKGLPPQDGSQEAYDALEEKMLEEELEELGPSEETYDEEIEFAASLIDNWKMGFF